MRDPGVIDALDVLERYARAAFETMNEYKGITGSRR